MGSSRMLSVVQKTENVAVVTEYPILLVLGTCKGDKQAERVKPDRKK